MRRIRWDTVSRIDGVFYGHADAKGVVRAALKCRRDPATGHRLVVDLPARVIEHVRRKAKNFCSLEYTLEENSATAGPKVFCFFSSEKKALLSP